MIDLISYPLGPFLELLLKDLTTGVKSMLSKISSSLFFLQVQTDLARKIDLFVEYS